MANQKVWLSSFQNIISMMSIKNFSCNGFKNSLDNFSEENFS